MGAGSCLRSVELLYSAAVQHGGQLSAARGEFSRSRHGRTSVADGADGVLVRGRGGGHRTPSSVTVGQRRTAQSRPRDSTVQIGTMLSARSDTRQVAGLPRWRGCAVTSSLWGEHDQSPC